MSRPSELRLVLILIAIFAGIGLLFWGVSKAAALFESGPGTESVAGEISASPGSGGAGESGESESTNSEAEGESQDSSGDAGAGGADGENISEAERIFLEGLARAEESGKSLFLRFQADWSPGCWQLSEFLDQPDIKVLWDSRFIDTPIDLDKIDGAKSLHLELAGMNSGLPWYAILNSDGTLLASSDSPSGNIGFMPEGKEAVDHFAAMISSEAVGYPIAEREKILRSLATFIELNAR